MIDGRDGTYVVRTCSSTRDAMGANAVNTMAEALAPRVAEIAGGRSLLRILTNKADRRLARARAVFDAELLGGAEVVDDISTPPRSPRRTPTAPRPTTRAS